MEFEVEIVGYLETGSTSLGTISFEAKDWKVASQFVAGKAPELVKEQKVTGFGFRWIKPEKSVVK